jgi:hypothetical protein
MKILSSFISVFFVCLLAQAQTAKTDTVALFRSYTGTYNFPGHTDFQSVNIKVENGKLMGKANVQPVYSPLTATKKADTFTSASSEAFAEITFVRNPANLVTTLRIYYSGQEVKGEKDKDSK